MKYTDTHEDLSWVLIKPRLTEKAARQGSDANAYTFDVSVDANKIQIKKAIEKYYGAKPIAINTIRIAPRKMVKRGRRGSVAGYKKAMVFLKKGDSIDFV